MNKTDRFLIQQAEVLLDEFFDMAGDADTKRLMKIGEWWRLVHIARFYSDDVNLSDKELFVLREGEKFWYVSQGAPILSESRIKDIEIAIKADWPEIHLALGFCSCIRIISHLADPIESAFIRHERIGFQFSGGRDSTAALYLLRDYWDRMTVYHMDTGDQFPETMAVVEAVERDVRVVRILGDVRAIREDHGIPSDVVPVNNTSVGLNISGNKLKIQSRYDCCYRSLMKPMHDRMLADDITLLVRGQRDDEYSIQPMRSGDVLDGQEVLYPIQEWNAEMVTKYIVENSLPISLFYERGMPHGCDCMGCTAWWDDGHGEYLKNHHPAHHVVYLRNMGKIAEAIKRQSSFAPELNFC